MADETLSGTEREPLRTPQPGRAGAVASALSPDGRTLAQVKKLPGHAELSLLDLESGDRRRIPVPGVSLDYPRWHPDGTLLAMASGARERGIVRIGDPAKLESLALVPPREEPLTKAEEFEVTPDGRTAAVLMTDSLQTHWWVSPSTNR